MATSKPSILFVVTEDWYFWSHRLDLARACRQAGFEVMVATRVDAHGPAMAAEGFRVVPFDLARGSQDPRAILGAAARLRRLYRDLRPDIVHHVALKPVLAGGIAARLAGVPVVVNAIAGLGHVFTAATGRARLQRAVLARVLRWLLRPGNVSVVVQNGADRDLLARIVDPARLHLIRGSGVDTEAFVPAPEPEGVPVAVLAARMLWAKGPGRAVEAARILRRRGVPLRIALVGRLDPANPGAIPEATLRAWADEGVVEVWGHRSDMAAVWAAAHIALLPTTYGEGLPKTLLEAAACGRGIVASDHPGCRELVTDGRNGLLVPAEDAVALADALQRLAGDAALRRRLGAAARADVEAAFSAERVNGQFLKLYAGLLRHEVAAAVPAVRIP